MSKLIIPVQTDLNLEKIPNRFLPIIYVILNHSIAADNSNLSKYKIDGSIINIYRGNEELVSSLPVEIFVEIAQNIFKLINQNIPVDDITIDAFLKQINLTGLKPSGNKKYDLILSIFDKYSMSETEIGFSIKSYIGSRPTLFNASRLTNFKFRINKPFSVEEMHKVNSFEEFDTRLNYFSKDDLIFEYSENSIFFNNLRMIDGDLPELLSSLVLFSYFYQPKKHPNISILTNSIETENPLRFDLSNNQPFYEYKIKKFLVEVALGMKPSKVWTGKYSVNGGMIIVKKTGDIVAYHLYDRNLFVDYLFHSSRLETPSSSRHDFGFVYEINGKFYLNLNLQIRFK